MGNVPLPAPATTVADDATAEVELLVSTAQKQLDLFRAQVTDIRGKDSPLKHTEVTGGRTLRYKEFIKIKKSSGLDKQIESAVEDFFAAAGGTKPTKKSAVSGLKKMVLGAAGAFLGTSSAGETIQKDFYVIFLHSAFVRLDVFLWKRQIKAKSRGSEETQSLVAYLCSMAVIPMGDLIPDEIDFLLSEALDTDVEDFRKVQKLAINLKLLLVITQKLSGTESVEDVEKLVSTLREMNSNISAAFDDLMNHPKEDGGAEQAVHRPDAGAAAAEKKGGKGQVQRKVEAVQQGTKNAK